MWDLSLPGYKYLGPGNPLDKGLPNNWNDLIALIHDIGYGKIIEEGGNPYLLWSDADAEAYKKFTTDDYGGVLAKKFFGLKKMAYEIGLISKFTMRGANKRPRDPFYENSVDAQGNVRRRISPFDSNPQSQGSWDSNPASFDSADWDELMEFLDTPAMQPNITVDRENVSMENAMSGTSEQPVEAAATAQLQIAGGPGGNTVSKETPISIAQPSYGLQETHTTILPWSGWLAAAKLDHGGPVQLKLRMNSPYDMLDATTVAANTKGLSATAIGPANTSVGGSFPEDFEASATTAYERPAWRNYWEAVYEYYTVLGCEYEIICTNPVSITAAADQPYNVDAVCAVQFDTYSSTATSTGNVMPLARLSQVRAFKNIKWYRINSKNGMTIIKGVYRPGQAKRNIVNDGDVKTWTATGAGPATLAEVLTLNFWADGLNNYGSTGVNMEINLKYIVQYKDLKVQARYPTTALALPLHQNLTAGLNTSDGGQGMQKWILTDNVAT